VKSTEISMEILSYRLEPVTLQYSTNPRLVHCPITLELSHHNSDTSYSSHVIIVHYIDKIIDIKYENLQKQI